MQVIQARNVNDAAVKGKALLRQLGIQQESRAGNVLRIPEPVTTVYSRPWECVMFDEGRDANPFFHLFEALWMIAGRDDVAALSRFNKRIGDFSDDGESLHGAYGRRWRYHWGFDQIEEIVRRLKSNKFDRRQILQMWDPEADGADQQSMKDLPCNTCVHFQGSSFGELDMTVFCRSNDAVWGCYGSDAVTFSILQQYVASKCGMSVGRYWQISDNFHAYDATFGQLPEAVNDPYSANEVEYVKLFIPSTPEINMLLDQGPEALGYTSTFIRKVAVPMLKAHDFYKEGDFDSAYAALTDSASDWLVASKRWLKRREARRGQRA